MEDLAINVVRRANALNISVSSLCRQAGVSRGWFEAFKKRVPQSIQAYNKIDEQLKLLENKQQ